MNEPTNHASITGIHMFMTAVVFGPRRAYLHNAYRAASQGIPVNRRQHVTRTVYSDRAPQNGNDVQRAMIKDFSVTIRTIQDGTSSWQLDEGWTRSWEEEKLTKAKMEEGLGLVTGAVGNGGRAV